MALIQTSPTPPISIEDTYRPMILPPDMERPLRFFGESVEMAMRGFYGLDAALLKQNQASHPTSLLKRFVSAKEDLQSECDDIMSFIQHSLSNAQDFIFLCRFCLTRPESQCITLAADVLDAAREIRAQVMNMLIVRETRNEELKKFEGRLTSTIVAASWPKDIEWESLLDDMPHNEFLKMVSDALRPDGAAAARQSYIALDAIVDSLRDLLAFWREHCYYLDGLVMKSIPLPSTESEVESLVRTWTGYQTTLRSVSSSISKSSDALTITPTIPPVVTRLPFIPRWHTHSIAEASLPSLSTPYAIIMPSSEEISVENLKVCHERCTTPTMKPCTIPSVPVLMSSDHDLPTKVDRSTASTRTFHRLLSSPQPLDVDELTRSATNMFRIIEPWRTTLDSTKDSHSKIVENIVRQSDEYFFVLRTLQRIAQKGIQLATRIRTFACNSDELYQSDDLRTVTKSLLEIVGEAHADTITIALQIHRIITKVMTLAAEIYRDLSNEDEVIEDVRVANLYESLPPETFDLGLRKQSIYISVPTRTIRQIVLSDMPPLLEGIVFEAATLKKSLDSLRDWWMSTKTYLDVIADGTTSELPIDRHKSATKDWAQLAESFCQCYDQISTLVYHDSSPENPHKFANAYPSESPIEQRAMCCCTLM